MPVSPPIANTYLDSCAFDPKYAPEDEAADQLFRLWHLGRIRLQITHSVAKEVEHPNTPVEVKAAAATMVYTLPVERHPREVAHLAGILAVLAGNGDPSNVREDAEHIFEAQKYGSCFVTADDRLLRRAHDLSSLTGPLQILRPTEMLTTVEEALKEGEGRLSIQQ